MDLVSEYASTIELVDTLSFPPRFNPRTGASYHAGVKGMSETTLVEAVALQWRSPVAHRTQVPYAGTRNRCDHVIDEWSVETKFVHLVGDNGKCNDYATAKMLSPFPKDRSLLHDAERLRTSRPSTKGTVLAVSFEYDLDSCDEALALHPEQGERIERIVDVVRSNGGRLSIDPLVALVDSALGPHTRAPFTAWGHPCGGHGAVFAWTVSDSL